VASAPTYQATYLPVFRDVSDFQPSTCTLVSPASGPYALRSSTPCALGTHRGLLWERRPAGTVFNL
jgi:hypothetical protein